MCLFYTRAIDIMMLTALYAIAAEQANQTTKKTKPFLDYMAMNGKSIVMY